jgi:phosphatidylglycerol lysyltransferase
LKTPKSEIANGEAPADRAAHPPLVGEAAEAPVRNWIGGAPRPLLIAFCALALAGMVFWGIQKATAQIDFQLLVTALRATSTASLAAAFAATTLSYLALIGYDLSGLRFAGARAPLKTVMLASFCGFAIGNSVGLGAFSGGAVRYRLYTAAGLSPGQIARVILFISFAFGVGLASIAALGLVLHARQVSGLLGASPEPLRAIAALVLALAVGFLAFCATRKAPFRRGPITIDPPGVTLILIQILLTAVDVLAAAATLWVLLPSLGASFFTFAAIYATALALGVLSHVPGGLGVFELAILFAVGGRATPSEVAAALVAYRAIYFLVPLLLSTVLLASFELRRSLDTEIGRRIGRGASQLAPVFLAAATFAVGATLVASGAMPAFVDRLQVLHLVVPLWAVEASHLLTSVAGLILLFAARGLFLRLDGAWWLALSMTLLSIPFSLVKGLAVVAPGVAIVLLIGLLSARRQFWRRASLLAQPLSIGGAIAASCVVVAMVWILFFAFRNVEYANELWWQFEFDAAAPRALRAVLGVAFVVLALGISRLLRPAPARTPLPSGEEFDRVRRIIAAQARPDAVLALMGDKRFLFSESGRCFLMFAARGRTWAALGDPIGPPAEWPDLVWRFIELADRHGGRAAFYQIPAQSLPLYLDAGLKIVKLGEEARVFLPTFTLEGPARADLRYALKRGDRDGLQFEMISPDRVASIMDDIERISNAWLGKHGTGIEKRFSVAAFRRDFVLSQPVALLRQNGEAVAFATVMTTGLKEEATVGLMRHEPDQASRYAMEYLFVRLIQHFRDQGYRSFSLGVVPLSGLREHRLAPRWHRLGRIMWSFGRRFYNFQGLRTFKGKFDPAWEPRYLAASGWLGPYFALIDIAALIGGGMRAAVGRRASTGKRRKRQVAATTVAIAAAAALLPLRPAWALDTGNLGAVHQVDPVGAMRGFVVLFSDARGWTSASDALAASLAREGALVVGVDLPSYLQRLDSDPGDTCHDAVSSIESTSRQIQRERGNASYRTPIVAGIGEGGALAGAILAQAPAATIAGAVADDPTVSVRTRAPLCSTPPAAHDPAGGFAYGPWPSLPGFWVVGFPADGDTPARRQIAASRAAGTPVQIEPLSSERAPEALAALLRPYLTPAANAPTSGIGDLPLIELRAATQGPLLVIILSGDGGWRDIDKSIAEKLQSEGVSVIGWDSLRYFWSRKSPEQTARDLGAVVDTYASRWRAPKVALVGYSFGADVLPFAYDRLSRDAKARVVQLSLLGFANAADFEITAAGWLGAPSGKGALPTAPALISIDPSIIQCFYGVDEDDSICPALSSKGNVEVVRTPGGHHFDNDYNALAQRILDGFRRRAGKDLPKPAPPAAGSR